MKNQNKKWYDRLSENDRRNELIKDTKLFLQGIIMIAVFWATVIILHTQVLKSKEASSPAQTIKTK